MSILKRNGLLFWFCCLAGSLFSQHLGPGELRFEPMEAVNSEGYEYAQGLIGENVLLVKPSVDGDRKDKITHAAFFDLYQWDPKQQRLSLLPFTLNSPAHEGSACWSEADQVLIFSRNNLVSDRDGRDRAGLFFWKNGQDTVTAFTYNERGNVLCHPTISADGKLMVFSADFPEGYGGMDLYYSVKKRDGWGLPVNLGPAINTPGNEVFPFLHRSETLFYSSDGFDGKGGLDLLYSTPLSGVWVRPQLLPEPFNSEGDDFSMWLNPLGTAGFLNSNRNGGVGNDDIYSFESGDPIFIPEKEWHDIEVLDRQSMTPVKNAVVTLQFNQAWNTPYRKRKNAAPEAEKTWQQSHFLTDSSGMVRLPVNEDLWLQAFVRHPDYQEKIDILKFDAENLWHQLLIDKKCSELNGLVLAKGSTDGIGEVRIQLIDDRGGAIDSCMSDSVGRFSFCLRSEQLYSLRFTADKWLPTTSESWTMPAYSITKKWYLETDPLASAREVIPEGPITKGTVFVFDQIYYDYNDSEIRSDATTELDALTNRMKAQPGMRIELIAHTDSRGNSDYNLRLSVARAEAARKYLIRNGINAARIRAIGYGENQLRNHCSDGVECSEEEHAYNRRTEIRILAVE